MLIAEDDTLTLEAVQRLQYYHNLLALGLRPQNGTYQLSVAGAVAEGGADVEQNGHAGAPHPALKMEDIANGQGEQGISQLKID
jgi:hypothetical protein